MSVTANTTFPRASLGWSIVLSVVMIVAGLLAIAMPLAAAIAVNIFVAWMLMFSGAAHLVFSWYRRHSRAFQWQFASDAQSCSASFDCVSDSVARESSCHLLSIRLGTLCTFWRK